MPDDATPAWAREVLADALQSIRLTQWEEHFAADLSERLDSGQNFQLSDKQIEVIRRIESKIYGT